jgi:hypothetical protein
MHADRNRFISASGQDSSTKSGILTQGGALYASEIVLDGKSKKIKVYIESTGHRPLNVAPQPAVAVPPRPTLEARRRVLGKDHSGSRHQRELSQSPAG